MAAPATLALITDIFPEGPDRNRARSIFTGMADLGTTVSEVRAHGEVRMA